MITISHLQAQRLVRLALDARDGSTQLPDEQWMALQAHLETCPECCAYRSRWILLEKELRRGLSARWKGVELSGREAVPRSMIRARQARAQRLNWAGKALFGALLLFGLVYLFNLRDQVISQAAVEAPVLVTVTPTPTPTPIPAFRGLVALETTRDGNPEIYLLQASGSHEGPDLINLTDHPARDVAPSWSPDGEWLAFLSDRGGTEGDSGEMAAGTDGTETGQGGAENQPGKAEVFLLHVAGSNLTQITDIPQLEWQGPITWSADGRSIALMGRLKNRPDEVAVYQITIDQPASPENGVRLVEQTQFAAGPLRYSPVAPLLAFGYPTAVHVGHLETDARYIFAQEVVPGLEIEDFQWKADGESLVYGVWSTSPTYRKFRIKQVREGKTESLYSFETPAVEKEDLELSPVHSMSPSPQGGRIAFLQDTGADGCWTVRLIGDRKPVAAPREIPGLCVDGRLEPASWSPDGRWLVVPGRLPGDEQTGLYTIDTRLSPSGPVIERLMDWPDSPEDGALPVIAVRPNRPLLGIHAYAAALVTPPPPTVLSTEVPGQLTFLREASPGQENAPLALTFLTPWTQEQEERLLPEEIKWGEDPYTGLTCTNRSPDGQFIAFYYTVAGNGPGGNHYRLLVTDEALKPVKTVDYEDWEAVEYAFFCPIWSADGRRLAFLRQNNDYSLDGNFILAVHEIPGDGDWLVPLDADNIDLTWASGLNWSPDGQWIWISGYAYNGGSTLIGLALSQVMEVANAPSPDHTPLLDPKIVRFDTQGPFLDVKFSPDGQKLFFLQQESPYFGSSVNTMQIRTQDVSALEEGNRVKPNDVLGFPGMPGGRLLWLPGGHLGLLRQKSMNSLYPYEWVHIDPAMGESQTILRSEEYLSQITLSPDGNWMAYVTQSGLWLLDLRGPHTPLRLGDSVQFLDWK